MFLLTVLLLSRDGRPIYKHSFHMNRNFSRNIVNVAPVRLSCLAGVGLICPCLRDDGINSVKVLMLGAIDRSAPSADRAYGNIRVSIGMGLRLGLTASV